MTLEVFPLWMLFKDFEVPLGSIVMWPVHNNIPSGWRICDGSSLSRTTYKELWAQIQRITLLLMMVLILIFQI